MQIKAFFDADWGSCAYSKRLIIRFCVFLGDSLISWKAKKQSTISRSFAKAKYRAMTTTTSKLVWLKQLLQDFDVQVSKLTLLFCDNQAAINIASNPTFHERTKHIEIDCHFVRDKVANGLIKLMPVSSQHQLVDIFTKPLSSTLLFQL